ncbi:Uncharacterized protein OBRU01_16194 [Operophtera brumata]|uniref:Uncharacterized protein n=1 Tax=Operophtera brumata TaxID=104452 RepID=A0A0L7L4L2_OPEBR|nr:Uncharacterized protein OBRU01_16194 [Operophtera brumata]
MAFSLYEKDTACGFTLLHFNRCAALSKPKSRKISVPELLEVPQKILNLNLQQSKTPDITPAIYEVKDLLCMPGVTIEAWKGIRKALHHVTGARPSAIARTTAIGSSPVGSRDRRAARAQSHRPHPYFNHDHRHSLKPGPSQDDARRSPSAPFAPDARTRSPDALGTESAQPRMASDGGTTPPQQPQPQRQYRQPQDAGRLAILETAIQIMQEVLQALRAGEDPVPVVIAGMGKLLQAYWSSGSCTGTPGASDTRWHS